jgi:hypothetical protein
MKKQAKPTDRERELIFIIDNLMWQSARYAHGRRTMAPSIIRECVEKMKAMYPDWKVKKDHMIEPRQPGDSGFDSDYLNDIFNPTQIWWASSMNPVNTGLSQDKRNHDKMAFR